MRIIINHSSMIPIYEQIVDQIKKQINNHTLKENDALPSVRSLAKELQISALTVKKAYDFLENEGLTKTIHGKGTSGCGGSEQRAGRSSGGSPVSCDGGAGRRYP